MAGVFDVLGKDYAEAKQMLAELDKLDASEPEFEELVTKFIQADREHITYEETQVWPAARRVTGGVMRAVRVRKPACHRSAETGHAGRCGMAALRDHHVRAAVLVE